MSGKKSFYITTTLPYVNAKPHIGFALEIIQADVVARYHKDILNENVFFNTGTDEHGQKIYQKAIEEGKDPQKYTDEYAKKFDILKTKLNLTYNNFIRTTDTHHKEAAKEIWKRCLKNGYIEKGVYKAKYCVGCELEKQDSDLVDGKCPIHPNIDVQLIEEDNYFFKFSKLQSKLLEYYNNNPTFVIPTHRLGEIRNFVNEGLQDFSISRLKEKMPWGVPVPGDEKHVMYVWFDALTNYISALGWPEDEDKFKEFWGTEESPKALQVAGKDNLRQQSSMWQAMLIAAGLPPSRQIFIHGFITSGGQKMSKSLGNVIDPIEYIEKYGTDALRYYLLAKISPTEDSDFTKEKFEETYNGDLANGLGNLVARVARLCELNNVELSETVNKYDKDISEQIDSFRFDLALEMIWGKIRNLDSQINSNELWKDTGNKVDILIDVATGVFEIGLLLRPFLPETANKIIVQFGKGKITTGGPLFPRV